VEDEAAIWPDEYNLTWDNIEEIMQTLYRHPFEHKKALRTFLRAEYAYSKALMDCMYTKQDDGNGWFVLHNIDDKHKAYCVYNLLSPVYDDRKTVHDRLALYFEKLNEATNFSFSEISDFIKHLNSAYQSPNNVLSHEVYYDCECEFVSYVEQKTVHEGVIISLALDLYHREQGRYPESLDELIPQYISTLPYDPFVDRPFGYRLDERDGYILYSVGDDCVDNGGRLRDSSGKIIDYGNRQDLIIYQERDEPYEDWFLVPVGATTQKSEDVKPR
jgi:hypothetical protein